MLALVWLLYVSFGVTAGSIAPLVDPIVGDLGMTYSQMGLVLGAWQLVYIGTAYPLGALIDRLGVRRSLGIGILIVWLSLALRGLAVDFPTLFLAVALFGVGGPIISIGAPKVVSLWFQGNQRGSPPASTPRGRSPHGDCAVHGGRRGDASDRHLRGISIVYGAAILAIALLWWALARDAPPEDAEARPETAPVSAFGLLGELLRIRNVQIIVVLAVATFPAEPRAEQLAADSASGQGHDAVAGRVMDGGLNARWSAWLAGDTRRCAPGPQSGRDGGHAAGGRGNRAGAGDAYRRASGCCAGAVGAWCGRR